MGIDRTWGYVRQVGRVSEMVTNVVLLAELLAQGCAHDGTSDTGWGIVMSLARLSPGGVEGWIES